LSRAEARHRNSAEIEGAGAAETGGRPEKTVSRVLLRATETAHWAAASVARRPYAALGEAASAAPKKRNRGTWFSSAAVHEVWLCQAGGRLATHLSDGTLLCDEQRMIWVIVGGAKFALSDAVTARRLYGVRAPVHVSSSALAQVGITPRDGTLLSEEGDARVYVLLGGAKHKVTACLDVPQVVPMGALAAIP
jgi:hypothetical protein